jgi:hypothetical protein
MPQHNNGVHPTRDAPPVMLINLAGGRVMPGVRPLSMFQAIGSALGWHGVLCNFTNEESYET